MVGPKIVKHFICNFLTAFSFLLRHILKHINSLFLRKTASVDIAWLLIYTRYLSKLSDQSESVFDFSLFLIG
jgi:hypothetical protein